MPVLIILGVVAALVYGWYASQKRQKELVAWCRAKGLRFDSGHDRGIDGRYPNVGCFQQGANRYAFNRWSGDWQGVDVLGFDYHYETYSHGKHGRQTHHHYFSAVIIESGIPLQPLSIRPENFFDKVTEFFGYDDIDFESAEFSRKFHVNAADKRWAYDVLHARAMEHLLGRPAFTLQFEPRAVVVWRSGTIGIDELAHAVEVPKGLLELLPEYVRRQAGGEVRPGA